MFFSHLVSLLLENFGCATLIFELRLVVVSSGFCALFPLNFGVFRQAFFHDLLKNQTQIQNHRKKNCLKQIFIHSIHFNFRCGAFQRIPHKYRFRIWLPSIAFTISRKPRSTLRKKSHLEHNTTANYAVSSFWIEWPNWWRRMWREKKRTP